MQRRPRNDPEAVVLRGRYDQLSIGEGQDGAPVRWGRWDGQTLAVEYLEGDLALMSVSPSGERLMSVTHEQDTLAVRDTGGSVLEGLVWDAETAVPRHPDAEPGNDEALPYWDWAGGFLDETTLIGSTVESDEEWGEGRHWIIGTSVPGTPVEVAYPVPVGTRPPTALGDGVWVTPSESGEALYVWGLDQAADGFIGSAR
ncbi:hypothetical protein ABZ079_30180 [Streptomyces sp. NPDC006314]|uniref:hypothetical protein n=1 Tax=Streptomyces sp. NPDC006314 TaxID=3154475 RepID=UPI0033BC0F34